MERGTETLKGEQEPHPEIQIGGQAVIEGVVMRGPERWALAVRRPDQSLYITVNPTRTLAQRYPRANVFGVRGILGLADSLIIGYKSLYISAGISLEETEDAKEGEVEGADPEVAEELPGKTRKKTGRRKERRGKETPKREPGELGPEMWIAMAIALVLFVGLFIVLPTIIAKSLDRYLTNTILYNLVEGGIRVTFFIAYLALMSLMPDIRRVFAYHGAEHMVVHAYEHGLPLTPESAEHYSTAHMRCGTAFLLIVLVASVLIFSLMGRPAVWVRVLERIAVIPLVAALAYEIIRFAGRHEDSLAMKVIMAPGLLLQRLTTRKPDREQLEVAIAALQAAVGGEEAPA
jgi:uncharacterized protein YqhQ